MPILLALLLLSTVMVAHAQALEGAQPAGASAVNGDVLYWEGEELVVKEISGRQVRLHVTAETKIAAQVSSDGHALSITLQIPDSGAGVTPSSPH